MSAGVVIPGFSKTVILMILGIYDTYLLAISTLNIHILFPMIIGVIVGGIMFLFLLNFLFKYVKSYTYFAIIGFILGSILVIYPGFTFNFEGLVSILLFIFCFFIGRKLG